MKEKIEHRGDYVYRRLYLVLPKDANDYITVELPSGEAITLRVRKYRSRNSIIKYAFFPHEYRLILFPGQVVKVWT